jgi:hypothetical protein
MSKRTDVIFQTFPAISNADWLIEQATRETNRLRAILRDRRATVEEKAIATDQLNCWRTQDSIKAVGN